ncbi:hypothetical protein BC830DRAFT_361225 [Chytriomyces sp. MP71]|nr:hypothetical protein BC830DRAFT_361225 [Chytriomyces sp. MP71]
MYEVTPVTIDGGFTMNVTAFPASHCAGSTMFLFEFRGKRVLYTGDMRADESLMQEILQTSDVFCNAFGNMRVIDALYIDTTFCDPRMHAFPSKVSIIVDEGIRQELSSQNT